ncbi:hypothetical protein C2G38_2062018 [Gigaspora rosea]|uniref:MD-2-related lipid-recognition domain-containing protein n=1 Tax=Gigaspora rosea TaxID=44941 RepID=A0A397W013_9GLOM|nr:hypothetical protein C2G38_2062018 [Gigaspora rosea]
MKNFILASILLALLLTVNAIRPQPQLANFYPCNLQHSVDSINVVAHPKTPISGGNVAFNVSGILTEHKIIAHQTILFISYKDKPIEHSIGPDYKQFFTASIKAGDPFFIRAVGVQTPNLPHSYVLVVAVGELFNHNFTAFGCVQALGRS